ncbi:hypothetical protein [Pseudoalteromonas sp. R3]|uniref:hypothetical protein n=1 Tax=Pseudoalteromonas sp. R3 TaxID=1709477 RepID=UPI0006B428BF|nr:hypothetical protein [Pseudoalteromonas sp. R3]AZZ95687.1 hypothetical protein ELR70_00290 [Pseudoalteromonas sp. R3]
MLNLWLDELFLTLAIIIALLAYIDWMLGEEKRSLMRESMGHFWLHIQDKTFFELLMEGSMHAKRWLIFIYHGKGRIFRAGLFSFGLSLIVFLIYSVVVYVPEREDLLHGRYILSIALHIPAEPTEYQLDRWAQVAGFVFSNAIINVISIAMTIFLLNILHRRYSKRRVALVILGDLVVALIAVLVTMPLAMVIYIISYDILFSYLICNAGSVCKSGVDFQDYIHMYFDSLDVMRYHIGKLLAESSNLNDYEHSVVNRWIFGNFAYISTLSNMWPTLLHLLFVFSMLFLKVIQPIIHPFISATLYALHESKKGVITSISIGLGVGIKLLQMWVKLN